MKTLLGFVFFIVCIGNLNAAADPWKQAESFFQQKLYDRAEPIYSEIEKNGAAEFQTKARVRAAECELLSGKIPAALNRLWKNPKPPRTADEALLAVLKIQVARYYLSQNADRGFPHSVSGKSSAKAAGDLANLSADAWQQRMGEIFLELYEQRDSFMQMPLANAMEVLNGVGTTTEFTPNIWTFIVENWTQSAAEAFDLEPSFLSTAVEDDSPPLDAKDFPIRPFAEQAASLWREIEKRTENSETAAHWARWRRASLALGLLQRSPKLATEIAQHLVRIAGATAHPRIQSQMRLKAAELFESQLQLEQAVNQCQLVEGLKQTDANACAALRARIQSPELQLNAYRALPEIRSVAQVRLRNIPTLHWRFIPTSYDELVSLNNRYNAEGFGFLRYPNTDALIAISKRRALKSGRIATRPSAPYSWTDTSIPVPAVAAGAYVLLVGNSDAFKTGRDLVQAAVVIVSNRALVGAIEQGESTPPQLRLYAWDTSTADKAETGEILLHERSDKNQRSIKVPATEPSVALTTARNWTLDALYRDGGDDKQNRGESLAYFENPLFHSLESTPSTQVFIETDRTLYRPDQRLMGKVTVVQRVGTGWKLGRAGNKIQLTVRDPQGDKWKSIRLSTDSQGSAHFDFQVASHRLLGAYSLEAVHVNAGQSYRAWESIQVDAYRRSQMELELVANRAAEFAKPHTVTGNLRYYSSQPVARTPVEWKMFRLPWLGDYRSTHGAPFSVNQKKLVDSGSVVTDVAGKFRITATPKPLTADEAFALFSIEFNVVGTDGALAEKTLSMVVGREPRRVSLKDPSLFYSPKQASVILTSADPDSNPADFDGEIWVEKTSLSLPKDLNRNRDWLSFLQSPEDWEPQAKLTKKIPARFSKTASVPLGNLDPGLYRLSASVGAVRGSAPSYIGYILVTQASGELPGGYLPTVALREQSQYRAKDTLRVLLGKKSSKGKAVVELWSGSKLLSSNWVDATRTNAFEFKLGAQAEGGVTARWFHAESAHLWFSQVNVAVPFASKVLDITFDVPEKSAPGAEVRALLSRAGSKLDPLYGTVRVVDAALEALAPPRAHWIQSLYPTLQAAGAWVHSNSQVVAQSVSVPPYQDNGLAGSIEPSAKLPGFYWKPPSEALYAHAMNYELGGSSLRMQSTGMVQVAAPKTDFGTADSTPGSMAAEPSRDRGAVGQTARQNFAETAFYQRDLNWRGQQKPLSWKLPDSLTKWNAEAVVYNSKLQFAQLKSSLIATRALTVRLSHSRILREKDRAIFSVSVTNDSAKAAIGSVRLVAQLRMLNGKLSTTNLPPKNLRLNSGRTQRYSWGLALPVQAHSLELTASAVAGNLADSEQRVIPVLSSLQRGVRSTIKALPNQPQQPLDLVLKTSPSERFESTTLGIFPVDISALAFALPQLDLAPTARIDATARALVPLGIMKATFQKFPDLKKHLQPSVPQPAGGARNKNRSAKQPSATPLLSWQQADSRRLVPLEQTPWVRDSQGGNLDATWLSLLKPEAFDDVTSALMKRLESAQLQSGAWPWLEGGEEDFYITQQVLESLSEAKAFGQWVDTSMAVRALRFLSARVQNQEPPVAPSMALRAAMLFLDFDFNESGTREFLKRLVVQLKQEEQDPEASPVEKWSPLDRMRLCLLFDKLGEKQMADLWQERVFEGSTLDPLTGLTWPRGEDHWSSHETGIGAHAAILWLVASRKPSDARVAGLVRSLLWNRYSHQWKSPAESTLAFAALARWFHSQTRGFKPGLWTALWKDEPRLVRTLGSSGKEFLWTRQPAPRAPTEISAAVNPIRPLEGFASLTAVTLSTNSNASESEALELERNFYVVKRQGDKTDFEPVESGESVPYGSEVLVELAMRARGDLQYLGVVNPRAGGFEPSSLESRWTQSAGIHHYLEVQDSLENVFATAVPSGRHRLAVYWRATVPGTFHIGPAVAQSAFAPAVSASSSSFSIKVSPP
jgi:hypothetical protein